MSDSYGVVALALARARLVYLAEIEERHASALEAEIKDTSAEAEALRDQIADIDSAIQQLREQE